MQNLPARRTSLIAFFLTQFHPIPENDEWWGKGFTEWTNTTKGRPLFPGHYQPHLPADLGFYDLRLREARRAQIALAKQYGIDGFCYHYYWFSGRRVLERPLNDMLADPGSDMPFCICWANENWSRTWDAAEHQVLLAQEHRPDDDMRFIADLAPILRDPRYIHHDGAPLLIVYRPQRLPDARMSASIWRDYCRSIGIPSLHLCAAMTYDNWDFAQFGFDSGVEFPPHNLGRPPLPNRAIDFYRPFHGRVFDYREIAQLYLARTYSPERRIFRTVFPSWDNTARRGDSGLVVLNGTPENYEHWLSEALRKTKEEFAGQAPPVFINAWNEWAEGCHLEPDQRYGRRFLAATLRAKRGQSKFRDFAHAGIRKVARAPKRQSGAAWWRKFLVGLGFLGAAQKLSKKEIKRRFRKYRARLEFLQSEHDRAKSHDSATSLQYQQLCRSFDHVSGQNRIHARILDSLRGEVPGYSASGQPMPLVTEAMAALPFGWVVPEGAALSNGAGAKTAISADYVAAVGPVRVGPHQRYLSDYSAGSGKVALPERFAARSPYNSAAQAFQRVENALVFTWMGAVMPQPGHLIEETIQAARAYDGDLRVVPGVSRRNGALTFDPKAVGQVLSIDRPTLVAYHGSVEAYGHWWFDSIPSIWLWREELKHGKLLLLLRRNTPQWIHVTLDLIGVPEEARLEVGDDAVHLRECVVASSCAIGNLVTPPPMMREIGRQLVEAIAGPARTRGSRKLYLSRSPKTVNWSRVLENEEEIVAMLARRGFEAIDPAALSIEEQIRVFSQAGSIVAPHGSGLANIIFAPPECGIVDLMPDVWTDEASVGWIYDTTNIMGQKYVCLLGETTWRSDAMVEHRSVPMRDLSMRFRVDAAAVEAAAIAMERS